MITKPLEPHPQSTEIPGGWRVDGLELPTEVYQKLAAISRRHTKDASLKEAISFLVNAFEVDEMEVGA